MNLWILWFLFNIRTISSMDIAMQLSFLLHLQWWHYITTLRYNGIVITEDGRGSSLFSIWSLISRPWEWAIVERNLYLGTNLLGAPCAIPENCKMGSEAKIWRIKMLDRITSFLQIRSSIIWSTCPSFKYQVNIWSCQVAAVLVRNALILTSFSKRLTLFEQRMVKVCNQSLTISGHFAFLQ